MPENDERELFAIASPIVAVNQDETAHTVRGFMSVETEDRHGDFVPVDAFNIASFMAKSTLLFNHSFWIDNMGNRRAIGALQKMVRTQVVKGDDDNFNVVNLATKEVVDTFPKEKGPDLVIGTKGIWVVAEVTIPEVWKMVESKELNTFSWRGLVKVDHRVNADGTVQKILSDIDLFEVSLVNIPANAEAIFVAKNSDGETIYEKENVPDLTVQMIKLDKSRFETEGMVSEYLKGHDLKTDVVREDQSAFFAQQLELSRFEKEQLVSIRLCDGVYAVAGPLKQKEMSDSTWLGEMLDSTTVEQFSNLFTKENNIMADTKIDEQPVAEEKAADKLVEDTKTEDVVETEKSEADKIETAKSDEEQKVDAFAFAVATKTSDAVVVGLKPLVEGFAEVLKSNTDTMKAIVEAVTGGNSEEKTKTEEKTKEQIDAVKAVANPILEAIKEMTDKGEETRKIAEKAVELSQALAKTTPAETTREEEITKEEIKKDADSDPNAVLNKMFPFLYGTKG